MRILYFTRDLTTHDVRFVDGIARGGHDVHVLRLEHAGIAYLPEKAAHHLRFVDWEGGAPVSSPRQLMSLLPDLVRVVEAVNPDIIHAGPIQTCALLSVLADMRPVVAMSWGSDILVDAQRDSWNAWATRAVLQRAAALQCDSDAVRAAAGAYFPMSSDRVVQFPWGLDLPAYDVDTGVRSEVRQALGWEDAVVVIATRAWHASYRIDQVVDAFAMAFRRDPRLRLVLAGTGTASESNGVRSRIAELGLDNAIHCPGMLAFSDLKRFLSAADIYVSAVPSDGTSISLLEALRFALPAVVPDNAGNREWVDDGINGFLVPPNDVNAMADRLILLAADPARATAFGANGQRRVFERADWNANFPRLLTLYEQLA